MGARRRPAGGFTGRRKSMVIITTLIIPFRVVRFTPLLSRQSSAGIRVPVVRSEPDGADLRPTGALLPELFPTEVRCLGASFLLLPMRQYRLGASRRAVYCRMAAKPRPAAVGVYPRRQWRR